MAAMYGFEAGRTSPPWFAYLRQALLWRGLRIGFCTALLSLLLACGVIRQAGVEPGYYRVQRGDTLSQIARKTNRSVAELQRWNKLPNVNRINVGQLLRITPPGNVPTPPARASAQQAKPSSSTSKPTPSTPIASAPRLSLVRPAQGQIIQHYNGTSSRGITIANVAGTPIVAAAAGAVRYVGSGLRAYGKLIIIQHDDQHLTIYAHNRALLVKEEQRVSQGQKIAEMGDTGSNRVALYFELRRNGQPIDPAGAFK